MLAERILKSLEKETQVKKIDEFRLNPSALSKCRRAVWYEYHCRPSDPIPPHSLVKMRMGDGVHSAIQSLLNELDGVQVIEIEKDKEIKLSGVDWPIRYRIDAVVDIDNVRYVLELKSTYSSGWDRLSIQADEAHLLQLRTYMSLEGVEKGLLLYIARDNGLMAEHVVKMSKEDIEKHIETLVKKGDELLSLVKQDVAPARDFKLVAKTKRDGTLSFEESDWQCRYCSYRTLCVKNERILS